MENLTKSQFLMQNVDYSKVIQDQIDLISNSGFIPQEINVTRHVYAKMKKDFCTECGVSETAIELKEFKNLPIRVLQVDNSFNNSYMKGFVFPIVVTMSLPEEEVVVHQLDSDSNETNEENEE